MAESTIEWTNKTWNPVAGCEAVSPGCANCYAATMTRRLEAMGHKDYAGLTTRKHFNGKVKLLPHKLDAPLHWKKPCRIFVNSMSDLFHEDVPIQFIAEVFNTIVAWRKLRGYEEDMSRVVDPGHTYQILTKRPERMRWAMTQGITDVVGHWPGDAPLSLAFESGNWPPKNCWLGVSVEDQQRADERIPLLLQTPAAVRFISCEPLLSNLDLLKWIHGNSRASISGANIPGLVPCPQGRDDLEVYGVRGRRDAGRQVDRAAASGREPFKSDRIQEGDVSPSREASQSCRASHRVHGLQQIHDSQVDGNQSQERKEGRQQTSQLGSRNSKAECRSFISKPPTQSESSARRVQRDGDSDGRQGCRDSCALDSKSDVPERIGGDVRRYAGDDFGHRDKQDLDFSPLIHWCIVGGESGQGARPCNIAWVRSIVEQCKAAAVPVFCKQLGSRPVVDYYSDDNELRDWAMDHTRDVFWPCGAKHEEHDGQPPPGSVVYPKLRDKKGGDMSEWPEDLRVRQFPESQCQA